MLWYKSLYFTDENSKDRQEQKCQSRILATWSVHIYDTCLYADTCLDLHTWLLTCIAVVASLKHVPPRHLGHTLSGTAP